MNVRVLIVSALLVTAPVIAHGSEPGDVSLPEGNWYAAVNGGAVWFDGPADTGFTAGGALGYDLKGPFRTELAVSYHRAEYGFIAFGFPGVSLETTISAWTAMLNGFYDLELDSRFTAYVGGGLGYSNVGVEAEVIDPFSGFVLVTEVSDSSFNFNLIGGVAYDLSENTALTAQYRYTDDAEASIIEVGVRFGF